MMHSFAQIKDGKVSSVTESSRGVPVAPDIVPLERYDEELLGCEFEKGDFKRDGEVLAVAKRQ